MLLRPVSRALQARKAGLLDIRGLSQVGYASDFTQGVGSSSATAQSPSTDANSPFEGGWRHAAFSLLTKNSITSKNLSSMSLQKQVLDACIRRTLAWALCRRVWWLCSQPLELHSSEC